MIIILTIIIGIIFLVIFYYLLNFLDKKKLKKLREEYNEDDDKSRQGEQRRFTGGPETTKPGSTGFVEPQRNPLLPTATPDSVGEDSDSRGKTGKGVRGIFRKLRKK